MNDKIDQRHQVPKPVADMFLVLERTSIDEHHDDRLLDEVKARLQAGGFEHSRTFVHRPRVRVRLATYVTVVVATVIAAVALKITEYGSPSPPVTGEHGSVQAAAPPDSCDNDLCAAGHRAALAQAAAGASDDAELKRRLRQSPEAHLPPTDSGPWAFAVVDTGQRGLSARITPDADAARVGITGNRTLVWVDCQIESTSTPHDVSGENDVGPMWVRVRWAPLADGLQHGQSDPAETQTAYMYRGMLEPFGHNGQIRMCPGSNQGNR